jgi:hypothetical protein
MLSLEFRRQLARSVFPRRERAGSDRDRDNARDQGSDGDAGGEVCSKSIGTPISYAYAVKAGPWIFLTGHEAFDFESGIPTRWLVRRAPLFGRRRNRREGDFILQRMRRQEFGSDLGNGFRFETWVR